MFVFAIKFHVVIILQIMDQRRWYVVSWNFSLLKIKLLKWLAVILFLFATLYYILYSFLNFIFQRFSFFHLWMRSCIRLLFLIMLKWSLWLASNLFVQHTTLLSISNHGRLASLYVSSMIGHPSEIYFWVIFKNVGIAHLWEIVARIGSAHAREVWLCFWLIPCVLY